MTKVKDEKVYRKAMRFCGKKLKFLISFSANLKLLKRATNDVDIAILFAAEQQFYQALFETGNFQHINQKL